MKGCVLYSDFKPHLLNHFLLLDLRISAWGFAFENKRVLKMFHICPPVPSGQILRRLIPASKGMKSVVTPPIAKLLFKPIVSICAVANST